MIRKRRNGFLNRSQNVLQFFFLTLVFGLGCPRICVLIVLCAAPLTGGEEDDGLHAAALAHVRGQLPEARHDLLDGLELGGGELVPGQPLPSLGRLQQGGQVPGDGPLRQVQQEQLLPGLLQQQQLPAHTAPRWS